jgi:hypothetical protein
MPTPTPPAPSVPAATPAAAPAPVTTPAATPAEPAPADDNTAKDAAKDKDLICKRVEKVTGSRMGTRRLCLTKEEWLGYEEN